MLTTKRTFEGVENDYVVLDDGVIIGRDLSTTFVNVASNPQPINAGTANDGKNGRTPAPTYRD
jgi:hypothetical protein